MNLFIDYKITLTSRAQSGNINLGAFFFFLGGGGISLGSIGFLVFGSIGFLDLGSISMARAGYSLKGYSLNILNISLALIFLLSFSLRTSAALI